MNIIQFNPVTHTNNYRKSIINTITLIVIGDIFHNKKKTRSQVPSHRTLSRTTGLHINITVWFDAQIQSISISEEEEEEVEENEEEEEDLH